MKEAWLWKEQKIVKTYAAASEAVSRILADMKSTESNSDIVRKILVNLGFKYAA